MNELISVIMPAYNVEKYIGNTIRSVQAQTYTDWELVIVNDGSDDNTAEIIRSFDEPRIRLFSNDCNRGAAVSRNRALREAKGRWMAFLDADDLWVPEKLEEQLRFMKERGYAFTFTDYRICHNGVWEPFAFRGPDRVSRMTMYKYNYFSTITVMYDREKLGVLQGPDLRTAEDYALWFEAAKKCDCYRFPKTCSYYIKHDGSLTGVDKKRLIKRHYLLFRNGLGYNAPVSAVLMVNNLIHGFLKRYTCRKPEEGVPDLSFLRQDRGLSGVSGPDCERQQI
ncbi:MAG: glycosyltransferase family 2 protein [Abditibacteriota bacterium]|nr:glycosyltransferase family 2 protein [Abditibacteriota bacterium]